MEVHPLWVSPSLYLSVSLVSFEVEGEMVGAGEAPITVGAFEGFGSGMLPVVAGQLVRPSESPLAARPGTPVRLLACKRTGLKGWSHENKVKE